MLRERATAWFTVQPLERRIALLAFLFALPSLAGGLQADDYLLSEQLRQGGPLAAYLFTARGEQASHAQAIAQRTAGQLPWWIDEHPHARFFRPLSSLSLWLDFASGAPPWWMQLENCLIYAAIVWLAVAIYRQVGLTGAGLGWAALFFGLDMAFAVPVGWIAARNTLLAACFGFACILFQDRAWRSGRPALRVLAFVCCALALLSGELGMCSFGYLAAHALLVDRAPLPKRVLVLSPYALLAAAYLAFYLGAGYGVSHSGAYSDVARAPGAALWTFIGSIPVWIASTATLPFGGIALIVPGARLPVVIASIVILAALLPLMAAYVREQPTARVLGLGALLSLVPLATVTPQERLRFFVALGVYGVLGPWVVSELQAAARVRRVTARTLWGIHGLLLPLLFIPSLFSVGLGFAGGGAEALDRVVPRAAAPVTILLNPPTFYGPLFQAAMRAHRGQARGPVFMLYAGSEALEVARPDARTLDVHAASSWFATQYAGFRDLTRWPFHVGERIALANLTVEVREVDTRGAPTRARFTFDRPLEDPGLRFHSWNKAELAPWTPPPVGAALQLAAADSL